MMAIRAALLPINQPSSGARAQYGNLLTLPLGGGLLYVQPVYSVRTSGAGSYPVLRYVLVGFGDRVAFGATLQEALTKVFNTDVILVRNRSEAHDTPPANQTIKQALAEAQNAYVAAQAALKAGNLAEYQTQVNKMKAAIDRAVTAGAVVPTPTPSATPTGNPSTPPETPPSSPPSSPTG